MPGSPKPGDAKFIFIFYQSQKQLGKKAVLFEQLSLLSLSPPTGASHLEEQDGPGRGQLVRDRGRDAGHPHPGLCGLVPPVAFGADKNLLLIPGVDEYGPPGCQPMRREETSLAVAFSEPFPVLPPAISNSAEAPTIQAAYWRRALGMQVRYVQHEDYQFCYSFRGRPGHKPTILMLHGFSAHKDMWLSLVKFLPKNLHLVCVDMPGHEGTTRSSLDDLSIDGQAKRIHQFVECLKLNKTPFHLIGTSMGGNVAGVYAAYYPSDVCGLSLVCPAGLQYSTDNQFIRRLRELQDSAAFEKIPLIPSTPEEMSEMLQLCSYVRFKVPQQILQGLVDVRIPHNDFYRKLFLEIINEKSRYSLHQNMDKIKAPTQVIWGKQDQVIDVSGADMLAKAIPNCQVDLLENCGHSVVMERPRKTAKLITDFLASVHNTDNNKKLD
ncbi:monoacylglycerol lipase ABHD6 isoform X2 [Pipistrellus kuhlii]|uniref:monoacylglycerol lipase ABHD6 isoform X2 n=1 Tax=Pipistrellus kuhlii TaxID=59472 RepID=UPI001E274235|nr:monoacylglycerol lipase ABHD6 isoform X2 [Pipistrellus kuhlii]